MITAKDIRIRSRENQAEMCTDIEATCGHESFASFDNERPTGNTRTVEVPIVKP